MAQLPTSVNRVAAAFAPPSEPAKGGSDERALDGEEVTQRAEGEPGLDRVMVPGVEEVGPQVAPATRPEQALSGDGGVELAPTVDEQQLAG